MNMVMTQEDLDESEKILASCASCSSRLWTQLSDGCGWGLGGLRDFLFMELSYYRTFVRD